jgi:ERCC4-type nuclease
MKTVTVLIDSREQRPLLFPDTLAVWRNDGCGPVPTFLEVKTDKRALKSGDYCLAGSEDLAVVERKLGIMEMIGNVLTADRTRFLRAINRFASSCKHPILLIEQMPPVWWAGKSNDLDVVQAVDLFLQQVALLKIHLLWCNATRAMCPTRRRRIGELVLRVMLAHKVNPEENRT